jgi:hypothetical protein
MVPDDGFLSALKDESDLLRTASGRVVAVARLESDAYIAGSPRTAWAFLGVPVAPVPVDGDFGVPVDLFGPHGRKVSNFGGLTTLDELEVDELLARCGLDREIVCGGSQA